ncbi:MAG: hypothetical protein RR256_06365, partial [Bacteroidales bacterium]
MDFKLLSKAKTYPWVMNLNISFRGYFLWNDTLFNQNNVIDFLSSYNTIEKVTSLLNELNGSFSICMEFEQQILIAVDRQRSLPLFYAIEQNCLYISHSASMIIDQLNVKTINSISVEELKSTSLFVTGKDTLIAEISQVCAGHLCVFNKSNLSSVQKEYFSYQWSDFYQDSKDELKLRFNAAYKKVGENMIKALNGRTAVIPLSGGYDSRMILQQLVEGGYKKILCYTYGNPNEEECLISKQVAQKYGVEWHIIPYTYSLMKSFYHSEEFKDYFSMEGNVVSLPHLQDLVAVLELKKQGVFPLDSVFIPGHSGDLIAGTGIPKLFMEYDRIFSKKDCVDAILAKHYPNNKVSIEVKNKLN